MTPPVFQGLPVIPNEEYTTTSPRRVARVVHATPLEEGAGMLVRRSIGVPPLRHLTPFLMLDHFDSGFEGAEEGAGAPDHPHRGQETITYVLSGGISHEDFTGQKGELDAGDLQFMTAGRGIMHSEMPRTPSSPSSSSSSSDPSSSDSSNASQQQQQKNTPTTVGLQLWVDLPRHLKYCEPRYRDLRGSEIPVARSDEGRVSVKVISGQAFGTQSVRELSYTPVWYLHFRVEAGGRFALPLPRGWNAFCYVLDGAVEVADGAETRACGRFANVVFEEEGDSVEIAVSREAEQTAEFILAAGLPLDQPVVQYGPFVATSSEEVMQAVADFRTGQNGFERAVNWVSENSQRRRHSVG